MPRGDQQHDKCARSPIVGSSLAKSQHFFALYQPAQDLIFKNRLFVDRTQPFAVNDANASNLALERITQKGHQRFAGLINPHAVQVEMRFDAPMPSTQFGDDLMAQFIALP